MTAEADIIAIAENEETAISPRGSRKIVPGTPSPAVLYLLVPALYLFVTLAGGLRLMPGDLAFRFLVPPLICLVLGAMALGLYFRSRLVDLPLWFSHEQPLLKNAANGAVLVTLFTATVQLLNALIPEQGIAFWVVAFCFFWTLWNSLFSDLDSRRLLKSLLALFGLAFAVKYLLLSNLVPTAEGNWLQRIISDPGKEAFTWLLDLPRYHSATGYIQFFTVAAYFLGLVLTPRTTK